MITYSIGRNRFDARPRQRHAETLREFAADVLRHRAPDKARAGYITAGFGDDGRRCAANALRCTWQAIDADRIAPDVLPDWRLFLARYRGFGWPTASSTPEAPRERVIVELSEPVDRQQRIAIGSLLSADIETEFGPAVVVDPCTYRPEQPCFLPLQGAQPHFLLGDALDVPRWLAQAPAPRPEPPPLVADAVVQADARMRWIVAQLHEAGQLTKALPNERGFAMLCPWHQSHTAADEPGSTATALLFPAEENGWAGAFKCLHSHCVRRRLGDLVAVLRSAAERQERAAA